MDHPYIGTKGSGPNADSQFLPVYHEKDYTYAKGNGGVWCDPEEGDCWCRVVGKQQLLLYFE